MCFSFWTSSKMFALGGIKALYRGVGPTTIRAAVLTGSQLATYDQTKRYLLRTPYFHDNFQAHAASAVVAALVTATGLCFVSLVCFKQCIVCSY